MHAHHVSTQGEEKRLPKAEQTCIAPKNVHRDGKDRVAEILAPGIQREWIDKFGGFGHRHDNEEHKKYCSKSDAFSLGEQCIHGLGFETPAAGDKNSRWPPLQEENDRDEHKNLSKHRAEKDLL